MDRVSVNGADRWCCGSLSRVPVVGEGMRRFPSRHMTSLLT